MASFFSDAIARLEQLPAQQAGTDFLPEKKIVHQMLDTTVLADKKVKAMLGDEAKWSVTKKYYNF